MNPDRFVFVQNNPPRDNRQDIPPDILNATHALYDIEDTSQPLGDRRVLASRVRFEAARMIVAALNHAV
jgi:hypothetical protein